MPFVRSLLQNLIRSYTISLSGVVVIVVEVKISNIDALILLSKVIIIFNFISFYVSKRLV